jgi:hypothetical protein
MRLTAAAAAIVLAALLAPLTGQAHKGITSKFTYNADVYPVFRDRCSACHVDGGVGPMSLVTYEAAFPWAESLRAELLAPASEDPHDFVRAAHLQISARELDIILDWATGGTPEGDKALAPAPIGLRHEWADGAPDLLVKPASPAEIAADKIEATHEFVLPLPLSAPRNVSHFDVLPGNPAIVRSAVVSIRSNGETRLLGTWVPRQQPVRLPLKPPVRLEPGSEVVARVHYKKTWKFEGEVMRDQSSIGLYFAD